MTVQTAFRIDEDLSDRLKSYCSLEGRSQTWVVSKAITNYLNLNNSPKKNKNGADRESN
jgi:predicted DNA-binding protein